MLLLTFADLEEYRTAMFWIMGSFSGASPEGAGRLALYLLPALAGLCALSRPLNLLAVGEETAAYLGVRVELVKVAAYALASAATAASVAASGVIGFVGLIVPHTVRLLWGGNLRLLVPASILLGAAFLALMDAVARVAVAPAELPIGVVTALVGVPFFVQVLRRRPA
ncbi:MAG: iron ABC transporter permease, partial [Gemmatimonadetes bacterium]|nr:iron ABC transporter permease [Gemmatimonadota bacterium]